MGPDRRYEISDLYHAALARAPGDREAFLEEACAGEPNLRSELDSLLQYASESAAFLEIPPAVFTTATPAVDDTSHMLERAVGAYRIVSLLGRGGMGEVYRARDSKLNREAAIKILPPRFTGDPDRRARLIREARLLATLNHPHIGAIYGVEETEGLTALALELVEGPTLAQQLKRGPLPVARALLVARQIADALDAAHAKGIVHRDLKPANIVLQGGATEPVCAKVLDFGIAKSTASEPDSQLVSADFDSVTDTAAGRILGTPAYMSPEQALGLAVDRRTDVWAFGCVVFEMLSGAPPFDAETTTDTMAHVFERGPDWSALPAAVPDPVRKLLRRCLQQDPGRRSRDLRDAILELDESLSASQSDSTFRQRRLGADLPIWAAVIAALMLTGGTWWLWQSSARVLASPPVMRVNVDLGPDVSMELAINPSAGISPNGERLVVISNRRLLTRRLRDSEAATLAGTEGASAFFFSPDSQFVAFEADGRLKRVALDGGSVTTLCELPPGPAPGGLRGGSWGEDNAIVLATSTGTLGRVPAGGGTVVPLGRLEGEYTQRWPQVLPGAKAVIFTSHRHPDWFDRARIDVLSLANGQRKTLVTGATFGRFAVGPDGNGYLTFIRAGTLFAVPFDPSRLELRGSPVRVVEGIAYNRTVGSAEMDIARTGILLYRRELETRLDWLESSGSTRALLPEPGDYRAPALSSDGNRIAFTLGNDVWVYDWQRRIRTQVTTGIPTGGPVWTSDDRFIVFSTIDTIAWVSADGGAARHELLPPRRSVLRYPTSIGETAGTRRLAFMQLDVGGHDRWDLWTVPLQVDGSGLRASEPEAFLKTSHDERQLRFSHDGRWVTYASDESGGRLEIYVRAFPDDGRRWKVSDGGGSASQWAWRPPYVFFQADSHVLMLAPPRVTSAAFVPGTPRRWSALRMVDHAGPSVFSVSRDGTRVAALVPDAVSADQSRHVITLWTDFLDAAGRSDSPSPAH